MSVEIGGKEHLARFVARATVFAKLHKSPFASANRSRHLRQLACFVIALVLQTMSAHAFAQAASCTGGAQTIVIPMPTTLNQPNNAPVGTLLTNIVTTPASNFFQCNVPSGGTGVAFDQVAGLTQATGSFGISLTAVLNGTTLSVFNTNVPGIGIAVGIKILLGSCPIFQPFVDLGQILSFPFPSPWVGLSCASSGTTANGAQVEAALVKTGPVSPGTVMLGVIFQLASFVNAPPIGQLQMQTGSGAPGLISFTMSPVRAPVRSCTTPNVTVSMGSYQLIKFKGVGSASPGVPFNLSFSDCSPGLTQIQYQMSAPAGSAVPSQGVINLSSDSTARGVGLQIVDGNGAPLKLDTQYTVSGVNAATNAYSVPFKAAYYQTAATVTAGTANANLTFTITYP
jgi:major type 1 subunit fimbrin (pilin)